MPSIYYVRKISSKLVNEVIYTLKNNQLRLVIARSREPMAMGYFENEDSLCKEKLDEIQDRLTPFTQDISLENIENAVIPGLIDPKCKEVLGEKNYTSLSNSLSRVLADNPDKLSECFSSENFKNSFKSKIDKNLAIRNHYNPPTSFKKNSLASHSTALKNTIQCENTEERQNQKTRHYNGKWFHNFL